MPNCSGNKYTSSGEPPPASRRGNWAKAGQAEKNGCSPEKAITRWPHAWWSGSLFDKMTHLAEFFLPQLDQFTQRNLGQSLKIFTQGFFHTYGGLIMVAVGTAKRFADNFINHFKFLEIVRGDTQGIGRLGSFILVSPKNGSATFG